MSRLGINLLSICAARLEINYVSVLLLLLLLILLGAGFVVFLCLSYCYYFHVQSAHDINIFIICRVRVHVTMRVCVQRTGNEMEGRPADEHER